MDSTAPLFNPEILKKIISTELIKLSSHPPITDFDKFISHGINTFIQSNIDIKSNLMSFITQNMIQINSITILEKIITTPSLHTAQTKYLIKAYKYFARKILICVLFTPTMLKKHDRNKCYIHSPKMIEQLQDNLMNKSYFNLPKELTLTSIKTLLEYIKNSIDSLRLSRFHSYVVGHFVESIITNTKYYSTVDSLKRCKCVDKENKRWLYTEKDFEEYARRIDSLALKLTWKNFKGNCYLHSTFPYVYVDYVVKSSQSEDKLLEDFNSIVKLISTKLNNFKLFQNCLKGYIDAVLLLSSRCGCRSECGGGGGMVDFIQLNPYKRINFKGSVVNNTPLMFENDMITNNHIIEIKTGSTDARKNMCKLILENLILSITNGRKFKNIIIFNPRSNLVSFISERKFEW